MILLDLRQTPLRVEEVTPKRRPLWQPRAALALAAAFTVVGRSESWVAAVRRVPPLAVVCFEEERCALSLLEQLLVQGSEAVWEEVSD